jgi:purine-binding chemotaxis protein CheW
MRAMRFKRKKTIEVEEEQLKIVTFKVGDEIFAADILKIKEIDLYEGFARVPDLPEFIEGFIVIRKDVVPLIDLRKRFYAKKVETDFNSRVIVAVMSGNMVGFVVDAVLQVTTVPQNSITKPPRIMSKVDDDYLQGVILYNNQRMLLVDFDKVLAKGKRRELLSLLSEEEKKELAKLALEEKKLTAAQETTMSL